jgi:hypothetical protein
MCRNALYLGIKLCEKEVNWKSKIPLLRETSVADNDMEINLILTYFTKNTNYAENVNEND